MQLSPGTVIDGTWSLFVSRALCHVACYACWKSVAGRVTRSV